MTNKALSFVVTDEYPWFRRSWRRKVPRFHAAALADDPAVVEHVLERIRAEGPVAEQDRPHLAAEQRLLPARP